MRCVGAYQLLALLLRLALDLRGALLRGHVSVGRSRGGTSRRAPLPLEGRRPHPAVRESSRPSVLPRRRAVLKIFSRKVAPAGGAEISGLRPRAKAKKVRGGGASCPAGAAASAAVRAARASRKGPRRPRTPRSSRPPSTPAPRPPWHRCLTSSKLLTITIPSLRQCARPIWRGASRSGARLSCRRLPKPGGFREAVAAAD